MVETTNNILEWLATSALSIISAIPASSEFWSGIIGAVVGATMGGYISYRIQGKALQETRSQRSEDRLIAQKALAHSLLFKVIRIHSDFYNIHEHITGCFEKAAREGFEGEPWQIVLPLANFPDPVHFSSDEMGMLLSLKNDDVFNQVNSLDAVHNSLIEITKIMSLERRKLGERIRVEQVENTVLSGTLIPEEHLALKPAIIDVNGLIENAKAFAERDVRSSLEALTALQKLFNEKLGFSHRVESKVALAPTTAETTGGKTD